MSAPLSLTQDFRLIADYVLKKLGPHCTLRDAAEFVEQTQSDDIAVACGVKDFNEILRVLAALKLVVNPLTPLARIIAEQSTHIQIEPTFKAAPTVDLNQLAILTQYIELQNELKSVQRWKQVRVALHVVLVSTIVIAFLLVFIITGFAAQAALPGVNGTQRNLLIKVLELAAWLTALCLCSAFIGQAMCCTAPESSGANAFFIMSGIGYILISMLGFSIVNAFFSKSTAGEPVDFRTLLENAKVTVIGGGFTIFMAHSLFLMGLVRITEHLGHKGMTSRIVSHLVFCLFLWAVMLVSTFWGIDSSKTGAQRSLSFDAPDPDGSAKQLLTVGIFLIGLLAACWMYILIIKNAGDMVGEALEEMDGPKAKRKRNDLQ
ncbi:MAG TPA: hypothetical protein VE988_24260 [Gemmataceae bacterium]|nr:hypothetical protein [Gemmataceae bacterium]